jgi:hypothetical protein
MMIKQVLIAACLVLPLSAMAQTKPAAPAAPAAAPAMTTQQEKMTACNKTAGEKKLEGDARKTFMSECLSSKPAAPAAPAAAAPAAAPAKMTQQEKMTACNKTAGEKKLEGDARKAFMSECLSSKPAAPAAAAPAAAPAKMTQQEKMTSCNKTAGEKKLEGDARKTFMSDCLKG